MFIPSTHADHDSVSDTTWSTTLDDGTGSSPIIGGWSSIIGIVCALVGNVLISVALNTQRYAHLRIAREAGEISSIKEATRDERAPKHKKITYGTIQEDIAEERAKQNANAPLDRTVVHGDGEDEHTQGDSEQDALIPHIEEPTSDASSESTIRGDEKHPQQRKKKNYLRSPWWWLGITLMTIGEAGNFLAYGFAPASIVSPLGVVALISNCLIAPIMLKERFRVRDLIGVIIAVGGAVTVVISAKGSNPKLGPGEIGELLKRWEFLTYLGITCTAIVVLMVLSNRYGDKTVVIDIGLVGLFGGYTALSTKGVASLLSYRLFYIFTFPIAYLLVAVLVFTAVMQIKYVNRALQRFDSTQVIPTQFVFFTIFVVTGSAVLYRDFEKTTADKLGEFFGGVALTFLGVWCITSGRGKSHDKVEDLETAEHHNEGIISLVDDEAPDHLKAADDSAISSPIATRTTIDPTTSDAFHPTSSSESSLSYVTASTALPGTSPSSTIRPELPPSQPSQTTLTPRSQLLPTAPRYGSRNSTPIIPTTSNTASLKRSRSAQPQLPPPSTPERTASGVQRPGAHRHISDLSYSPIHPSLTASPTNPQAQDPTSAPKSRHPSIVERMFASGTFRDISGSLALPSLGPLSTPLSAGLSVVVADSLRGLPRETERDPGAQSESRTSTTRRKTGDRGRSRSARRSSTRIEEGLEVDGAVNGTRRSSRVIVEGADEEEGRATPVGSYSKRTDPKVRSKLSQTFSSGGQNDE